jgi:D-tyrosyl-tRNA(Tyr) deacylase
VRVVLQRVSRASVSVDGAVVSSIEAGMCLLVGIEPEDGEGEVFAAVQKIVGQRIFGDETGKMNLSIGDVGGELLVVSQFTLAGDVRKGRRPSFTGAAPPEHAEPLIGVMVEAFEQAGIRTRTGVFGARMSVEIANDGPVTLVMTVRDGRVW